MFLRYFLTLLSFCLFVSLHSQTIGVTFDVDFTVGGGNKKVIITYCASGDFVPADGTDDWGAQWLTIGFEPSSGIVAGSPSTQLSGFSSDWLPFVEAFGAGGGQLNTFEPSGVGGTDDGNVYFAVKIDGATTNKPLASGVCEVIFEFLIPLENGTPSNTEMFLLDEGGLPGAAFAFAPNVLNNGFGGNVYNGIEPESALPIKLNRFTATKVEKSVNLNWSTSSEINASHFDVQRSQDLSDWATIGTLQAIGESITEQNYDLLDSDLPLNTRSSKTFYYRLNMVDNDGEAELSEIRTVRFDQDEVSFIVYPNPSNNEVFVNLSTITSETGPATLNVINMKGERVKEVTLSSNDDINVDMSNITAGVYLFVVKQGQETFTQKVIKID